MRYRHQVLHKTMTSNNLDVSRFGYLNHFMPISFATLIEKRNTYLISFPQHKVGVITSIGNA